MSKGKASSLNSIGHKLAPWALPVLLLAVWQLSVSAGWLST
ncbi:aliphatic sulfonate ABC transporter permease SsuC, partial [Pseudomonas fragi]|nr:aliphatic sulfonate ABC transporter permease SsuC [Pseudomonas sp. GC01]